MTDRLVHIQERGGGYVALYRNLLHHPLTTQLPAAWFRIFIVILMKVNWKPGVWWNGKENVTIMPGSMVTSVDKLSKMSGSTVKQVRGCLEYLSAANTAAIEATSHYTLITLLNWETYQSFPESDGEPQGKPNGKPGAKQGQAEGKPGATIEEVNQEIIQERKTTPSDISSASPNTGAKTQEASQEALPENEEDKHRHTTEGRRLLARTMARHLAHVIGHRGELEQPSDDDLDGVLAVLANCRVETFCDYLRGLPRVYQAGGRAAPRTWGWFISTARNFAGMQTPQLPTRERCKHGQVYGVCCNTDAQNAAMSASFSTLPDDPETLAGAARWPTGG